jgi:transposase-like protein
MDMTGFIQFCHKFGRQIRLDSWRMDETYVRGKGTWKYL